MRLQCISLSAGSCCPDPDLLEGFVSFEKCARSVHDLVAVVVYGGMMGNSNTKQGSCVRWTRASKQAGRRHRYNLLVIGHRTKREHIQISINI